MSSTRDKLTHTIRGSCLVGAAALVLLFLGFFVFGLSKMRQHYHRDICLKRLASLSQATWLYCVDHTNQFPPAETWCDAIKSKVYVRSGNPEKAYLCPSQDSKQLCHFGYNSRVAGLNRSNVAPDTVVLFETTGGWNVAGGREKMITTPLHQSLIVAFGDGSVTTLSPSRAASLRWDP